MDWRWEDETEAVDHGGGFEPTALEAPSERWRQLLLLAFGLGLVWLGHEISTWALDPRTTSVRLWVTAVELAGLALVLRAIWRFVESVSNRQTHVFRVRHLVVCGVGLLTVGVVMIVELISFGPLDSLLSGGRISGPDIADVGFVIAAGLCLVGAATAFTAAFTAFRAEHRWQHPMPPR